MAGVGRNLLACSLDDRRGRGRRACCCRRRCGPAWWRRCWDCRRRAVSRQSLAHRGAAGGGAWRSAWRCSMPSPACSRRQRMAGPGAHGVPRWWPPPRSRPGLPPDAQQRGRGHRHLRAGDRLSPDLSLRCRSCARHAARRRRAPTPISSWAIPSCSARACRDDETLPAQFATANDNKVRALNLSVPGNAPNHLVRAFEAGLLDRYAGQPVKAVVTWIIPAQLARITGDGSWLGSSPRYVLETACSRHTGSFNEYRLPIPSPALSICWASSSPSSRRSA